MQGAQHPTLQFYTRPTGGASLQFVVDEKEDQDLINSLKNMIEDLKSLHNNNPDRFRRIQPLWIKHPVLNMAGMHYFSIEDMSIQSVEGQEGLLTINITVIEQVLPPVDADGVINQGLTQTESETPLSIRKLASVMNFIADPQAGSFELK